MSGAWPSPESVLPRAEPLARLHFRARHAARVAAWLPWLLARQLVRTVGNLVVVIAIRGRSTSLLGGRLQLTALGSAIGLAEAASTLFGERHLLLRWKGVVVDPGPVFALQTVLGRIEDGRPLRAVLVTHRHEEHAGNAGAVAAAARVPVIGSATTLDAIRLPPRLPFVRRWFGQPCPAPAGVPLVDSASCGAQLASLGLVAIDSPGHCDGHVSFHDPAEGILFAGDSFLHVVFTAPNADCDVERWIATLESYTKLDVRVLVGSHGRVMTTRDDVGGGALYVERRDPNDAIREKLAFLRWARAVTLEGHRRGLPAGVIEASIFPWTRESWLSDHLARILSFGAFSRSVFIRSLLPGAVFPSTNRAAGAAGLPIPHALPK